MNRARVLIGLLLVALPVSCTLSQHDPTGFMPMHAAPEPGYTQISDHFGVEITGGIFTARKAMFFHIRPDVGGKELIGATLFPVYGSRQGAYAISEDGKVLLFMHDERLNQDGINKTTGLYQFTHEIGNRLIHAGARSVTYINEALPLNAIVLQRNCDERSCEKASIHVRSTEGEEYVWRQPEKPKRETTESQQCQDPFFYDTADAHPGIRWISTKRGGSCIMGSGVDGATIETVDYMSSGLYRFVRECRTDDQTIYRLFEYKNSGLPYLFRLHPTPYLDPRAYVTIVSHHKTTGAYQHSVAEKAHFASSIRLCPPEVPDSK